MSTEVSTESPCPLYLLDDDPADRVAPEFRDAARQYREDGLLILDFDDDRTLKLCDRVIEDLSGPFGKGVHRIQDAWRVSQPVRDLASHPRVLRLLAALYGRRAFPFQTLNFEHGSEQSVHSDATHFFSLPPDFMCGVWIALEDIGEEAGPLVYYPGSHRLPTLTPQVMGINSEAPTPADYDARNDITVEARIETHGLERKVATLKKGQAVVWAANLLHGGSHILDPGSTRRSLVTHYFFENCFYYTPMRTGGTEIRRDSVRIPQDLAMGGRLRWPTRQGPRPTLKTVLYAARQRLFGEPICYEKSGQRLDWAEVSSSA